MQVDVIGKAIWDYYQTKIPQKIYWETEISETDDMDVSYFFRTFNKMPTIEQKALHLAFGKTLDVGCGAGAHLAILQDKGIDVTGIDVSEWAVNTCQARGFEKTFVQNILNVQESFDTLLLLMNGTGIFETLEKATNYLKHLKTILNPNGQILIDSSYILYMYDREEDSSIWSPHAYYGELTFTVRNNTNDEQKFPWLFIDFDNLKQLCSEAGLKAEQIMTGEHHDYLCRITIE